MSKSAHKNVTDLLEEQASFRMDITNEDEYEKAQALMDELLDIYNNQRVLIEMISRSIERYENSSDVVRIH